MNEAIKIFLENWKVNTLEYYKGLKKEYYENGKSMTFKENEKLMCGKYGNGVFRTIKENHEKTYEAIIAKEADNKYKKLIASIENKAGTIVDAAGLSVAKDGTINGLIVGEKETVRLETIKAGGHNVQCLHFRTKVSIVNNK